MKSILSTYIHYLRSFDLLVDNTLFFSKKNVGTILAICVGLVFISPAKSQVYPAGFNQILVAGGISNPTVMTFAPDGRIFIAQQNGQLRIIKNGSLLAQPFISLSVNSVGERGLLGIAFDPAFATNNFIYLYYTLPSAANNRVSRFTANGDVAVPGSEVVILNLDPLSSASNHNGGTMQFGPDGRLYIGVGENANGSNAQNLDTYLGKILRINSNGTVPPGNPFPTGSSQRQRVWQYGLRNPYTITFQPGTGRLFINDVGQNTWEEINDGTAGGKNFGWPTAEGNNSNPAFTNPVYAYSHGAAIGQGCAITGGTFFNPTSTNYPASYIGKYFYIDYCGNWIDTLRLNGSNAVRGNFASNIAGSPVSIVTGPDGNLYFLSRSTSAVYRIVYTGSQINHPPNAVINTPIPGTTYVAGTSISFSGSGNDPEDGTLGANAFNWYVVFHYGPYTTPGPSAPSGVTNGSFTIPNTGEKSKNVFYRLYLVVTDSRGAKDTTYRDILPRTSILTLNTNPQGMQVTLDGQSFISPFNITSVEGMLRVIGSPSPQTLNGINYGFTSWNHGGAQTQTITTPVNNTTYTANFSANVSTTTLNPVADAYVRSRAYGLTNYGSDTVIITQNSGVADDIYQSYLRFNISSLPANNSSVKLGLYGSLINNISPVITVQLYNVPSVTWDETTITNTHRPAAETSVLAATNISGTVPKYYEWDITSYVNARRNAGLNAFSIEVRNLTVTANNRAVFRSRENALNRPQLSVTRGNLRPEDPLYTMHDPVSTENKEIKFYVYPNPAANNLSVKFPSEFFAGTAELIDFSGKVVMRALLSGKNLQTFDLSNLANGVYILQLKKNDKKYSERVFITKGNN